MINIHVSVTKWMLKLSPIDLTSVRNSLFTPAIDFESPQIAQSININF